MTLLIIGRKNATKHIVVGTYEVNEEDVYKDWTDGNLCKRREVVRTRVKGSFEVYFRSMDEYQQFVDAIESNRSEEGCVDCNIMANNTDRYLTNRSLYFTLKPKRSRAITGKDYFPQFEVEVEER